jgi:hypothetical protein
MVSRRFKLIARSQFIDDYPSTINDAPLISIVLSVYMHYKPCSLNRTPRFKCHLLKKNHMRAISSLIRILDSTIY